MSPSSLIEAGVVDAWSELGETFRDGANEPISISNNNNNNNNNQAPQRDEASDKVLVAAATPRSQRQQLRKITHRYKGFFSGLQ
jgi:hypothetical protein